MPGTTRYSATFDRTYEEEDPPPGPPVTRRSRSLSLQMDTNGRGPLLNGSSPFHTRSSSTENGAQGTKSNDAIPTRSDGKAAAKAHNNPFQFVKVAAPIPRFSKTDEQKKAQAKKEPILWEGDEDEWQSNLDGWKSRRRKMSEGAFLRQEELRRLQQEEETNIDQQQQKKVKKFSEIVNERATRGRAMSMCLFSNPLESDEWIFENSKRHDILSGGSATSSNINSDEDLDNYRKQDSNRNSNGISHHTNDNNSSNTNGIESSTSNSSISKTSDLSELDDSHELLSPKDNAPGVNGFIDSGLESLSSSHRLGDMPDSGSDFSQDSGSSIDCDSPRVSGLLSSDVEVLKEYGPKQGNLNGAVSPPKKSNIPAVPSPVKTKPAATGAVKKVKAPSETKKTVTKEKPDTKVNKPSSKLERSIESENEMFVDDFDELRKIKTAEPLTVNGGLSNGLKFAKSSACDPCLNVVYQSPPVKKDIPIVNGFSKGNVPKKSENFSQIKEVPVEKVTEEMERLILEQLEEEERAKEIITDSNSLSADVKSLHELPVRNVEPPKEKPPPPPTAIVESTPKDSSVKRVNSTKRILKEISKRRSDFLGIENSSEQNALCELSLPPPLALEDILRAEHEQDLQRRQIRESSSLVPSSPTEDEIARKEQEIIANLETEERMKSSQNCKPPVPDFTDAHIEEERIKQLKEERKKMEDELMQAEAQKIKMEEALLLQREEMVIKQEANLPPNNSTVSDVSVDKKTDVGASDNLNATGDGKIKHSSSPSTISTITSNSSSTTITTSSLTSASSSSTLATTTPTTEGEVSESKKCPPTPPPKPAKKKKEALRKERERLRQEQEDLQREREEHRKMVQLEQEQLKNSSKHHVPEVQVGPPPPAKPVLSPQVLTSSSLSPSTSSSSSSLLNSSAGVCAPNSPEKIATSGAITADCSSQSPNKSLSSKNRVSSAGRSKINSVDVRPPTKIVPQRKLESTEPRYNKNHWLIQEAEMRRIAEQKERQRMQNSHPPNPPNYFHPIAQYPEDYSNGHPGVPRPQQPVNAQLMKPVYPMQRYNQNVTQKISMPTQPPKHIDPTHYMATYSKHIEQSLAAPAKPSRVNPMEKQEQMLSVSGRKRCSHCGDELGRGAAMIIESLQLYYHIHCFRCCVCQTQLGNGSCGTDVRVRNNKLHCHNCYSNDEAGLKFSQV